jgi:hypothetical protein
MDSEYSSPQLQAHLLELERVLERVECASTLYQVLALKQSATAENMKSAYRQTVTLLNPSDEKHRHLDPKLQTRMKRALNKVANAFSVLTNYGKRVEYDNSLVNRAPVLRSVAVPKAREPNPATKTKSADFRQPADIKQPADLKQPADIKQPAGLATDSEEINIKPSQTHEAIYTKPAEPMRGAERRGFKRYKSRFPARVTGHDRVNGKWDEMAETIDVSKGGAALRMTKAVRQGMVLLLMLPLPVKLRCHGYIDPVYRVYGIVRHVIPTSDEHWIVGLEFLGESPPAGYRDEPWATFKTTR